jgi:hypothetical protein
MSQSSILTDALSSACWEEKRKKKTKRNDSGAFFPRVGDAWLAVLCRVFSWLLDVNKG